MTDQQRFELAKEIYIDLRVCEENINTDINDLLLLARPIAFQKWKDIGVEWELYHFAINDGREWISVKDRLPDNLRDVEISWHKNHKSNKEKVRVSHYRAGNWYHGGTIFMQSKLITHWRELSPYTKPE